ncbi:hypothetical protein V6N13_135240 [Hibiscus sabdariffa]
MAKVKARVGNLERGGANQYYGSYGGIEIVPSLNHVWWFQILQASLSLAQNMGMVRGGIPGVGSTNSGQRQERVGWSPPPPGWIKFNADGAQWGSAGCFAYSADAIQLILDGRYVTPSILIHISEWRTRPWALTFTHIKRDGNRVVDSLAKMTTKSSFEMLYHVDLPSEMLDLLHEDMVVS